MSLLGLIARPSPVFVGCCAKVAVPPPPEWLERNRVEVVASVSQCISHRPDGWFERGGFNRAGYYNSPQEAAGLLRDEDRLRACVFAYSLYPLVFDEPASPEALGVRALHVEVAAMLGCAAASLPAPPSDNAFERLGFDVVSASMDPGRWASFDCSPLSCNARASDFDVNRWCLLSQWDDAVEAARSFASGDAEPPPYVIFDVWRQRAAT